MKQFFKFMFASMLGFILSMLFIGFLFLMIILGVASSVNSSENVTVKNNSILQIKLDYSIPERTEKDPQFNFPTMPNLQKYTGLSEILNSIKYAKNDSRIQGIHLVLDNFSGGGVSKISEIRNALKDFKKSEKFIIAHGNSISEGAYFLASVADSIYLTPTGLFEFDGFGIEMTFFKKLLDKLEVEPQIFQYGKFKSATEPFKSDRMSDANREQLEKYLTSVYDGIISRISESKNISPEELKNISEKLLINSAEDAVKYGLITDVAYEDNIDSLISQLTGLDYDEIEKIDIDDYAESVGAFKGSGSDRIAIVYANGEITEGKGDESTIGKENIIKALDKAYNNSKVKAIVMRVNSPGGSSLTSDMIWRKVNLIKKDKPVIVSMSNLAASGGYYISCSANKIVAEPNTLTGSIGVFGIIPNAQKFFNNKLGVTFDEVMTSENAQWASYTNPLTKVQKRYIQNQVDEVYFDFVNRVVEGRDMTFDEVDAIGQGRIWSGIDAIEIGLLDTLGGMDVALQIAAKEAGITEYRVIEYPFQKEPFEKIMEMLSTKIEVKFTDSFLNDEINQIRKLKEAIKFSGIQTRLPFDYEIK